MKIAQNFRDLVSGRTLAVSLAGVGSVVPAFAQAVDPFDTAMTTITGKVGTYAAALVGLGAVAVVFMVALKYVKKIPSAS